MDKYTAIIWAVIAGVISLLQALTWLGLGITSLLLYGCQIKVDYSSFTSSPSTDVEDLGTLLYTVYYYNPECENPPANSSVGWNETATLSQAYRTWQWSIAYVVVSGAWVITSFFLIVTCCKNRVVRFVVPSFWLLTTLTCIVMDVVASIQYGLDIGLVLDNKNLVPLLDEALLPITPNPALDLISGIPLSIAVIPSVAMTLAVSRCIILWIINVILFLGVLITTCMFQKGTTNRKSARQTGNPQERNQETPPQEEFLWRGGAQQNPAYLGYDEAYDQHDPGPIPQRHSYLGDPELYVRNRNSAEIRQHQPWSYLHPLEEAPTRPMSPNKKKNETDDWDFDKVPKIPRAQYAPSAPANSNNNKNLQPNYFHYPYQSTAPTPNQQSSTGQNIYLRD